MRRWKLLPVDVVKVDFIRPNVSFRCQAPVRVLPTRALRAETAGNEQVEVILDDAQAPAPRRRVEQVFDVRFSGLQPVKGAGHRGQ